MILTGFKSVGVGGLVDPITSSFEEEAAATVCLFTDKCAIGNIEATNIKATITASDLDFTSCPAVSGYKRNLRNCRTAYFSILFEPNSIRGQKCPSGIISQSNPNFTSTSQESLKENG